MNLKPILFIEFILILIFFSCEKKSSNIVSEDDSNLAKEIQIINTNNNAKEKPIRKPKPNYICEVHFFDGAYEVLKSLGDFKGNFNKVKRITIQNQDISKIPDNIPLFTEVELLDLSHNKIKNIDPTVFSALTKLKKLYINANPITKTEVDNMRKELIRIQVFDDEDFNN